ncbi:hypothetical protein FRC08_004534 [Ceratobasidium sp. 394]|nr:hypothetical protein FRC08_004534 [Ceratobasidium sp. 394]
MSLASLEQKNTVWSSSHEGFGLTADQLQSEQKWIQSFNDTSDELNWDKWRSFWADGKLRWLALAHILTASPDAFFVFGHKVRIEGKAGLTQHFNRYLQMFKSTKHEVTRHSFDHARGLIYQTANVTSIINGDPEAKPIVTPMLMIIHRQVGESKIHSMEMYGDFSQVEDALKDVLARTTS